MSHRVTAVSAQEHNAFIGLLLHDGACRGCSCKNLFSSPAVRVRTEGQMHKPFCLQPLQFSSFQTLHRCGKLPIATIGFRSSKIVQHLARPVSSSRLQPVLRSRTTLGSMLNKLQLAACRPGQKASCHLGCFATRTSQSHHLTVCRLDKSALFKVLQARQPCIVGHSSTSLRRRALRRSPQLLVL